MRFVRSLHEMTDLSEHQNRNLYLWIYRTSMPASPLQKRMEIFIPFGIAMLAAGGAFGYLVKLWQDEEKAEKQERTRCGGSYDPEAAE